MAKLTNAQLVAQLEAAHVSYQALAAQHDALRAQLHGEVQAYSELHGQLEELSAQLDAAQRMPAKQPTAQRWVRRAPSEAAIVAHDEYARALLTARELAIRTGRSVRVG